MATLTFTWLLNSEFWWWWWWWSRASCPRMSVGILGTNCDQCWSMVQYCFTSTETIRLVRTESPGWLPWLSHSSWALGFDLSGLLHLLHHVICSQNPVTPSRIILHKANDKVSGTQGQRPWHWSPYIACMLVTHVDDGDAYQDTLVDNM